MSRIPKHTKASKCGGDEHYDTVVHGSTAKLAGSLDQGPIVLVRIRSQRKDQAHAVLRLSRHVGHDQVGTVIEGVCQMLECFPLTTFVEDRGTVSRLANLSSRAWDVQTAETRDHVFSSKVDGERRWLVISGIKYASVSRDAGPCQWQECRSSTLQPIFPADGMWSYIVSTPSPEATASSM